jgi:CxxC-x17-CxxC domain-containing protein
VPFRKFAMGSFREHNKRQGSAGFRGNKFGGNRFENDDRPSRGGFGGRRTGGFGRNNRSSGGFGGERRSFDRPEMHEATCSKCGKSCQVPFKPTGSKPVFCSDCFRQQGDGQQESFARPQRSAPVNSGISQEQFKQLNDKLDKILAFLATLEIEVADDEDLEDSEEE